jgi:murein DD-endopeptidase MepM/ murein hydrolase activator NlpD
MDMRRVLRWAAAAGIGAYAVVLLPYVRALWWLHAGGEPASHLLVPVEGVALEDLRSSFGAPRAHGPHEGIDIAAPAGTPVFAVAEGVIIGNRVTQIGGNVLWIMGRGRRLYYYAHLQELAPAMRMGRHVAAGELIGRVGNSGNAAATIPHLHFAIYLVTNDFYPFRLGPRPLFSCWIRRASGTDLNDSSRSSSARPAMARRQGRRPHRRRDTASPRAHDVGRPLSARRGIGSP